MIAAAALMPVVFSGLGRVVKEGLPCIAGFVAEWTNDGVARVEPVFGLVGFVVGDSLLSCVGDGVRELGRGGFIGGVRREFVNDGVQEVAVGNASGGFLVEEAPLDGTLKFVSRNPSLAN